MEGRQRRSFTDDYKRQAVAGGFERPLDRFGGQRTWPARFRFAPLGGTTRGRAGADGGVAAPDNAGDAAVGGSRGRGGLFATGERAAAHGARHFKKLSSTVARLCGVETALCYPLRLGG